MNPFITTCFLLLAGISYSKTNLANDGHSASSIFTTTGFTTSLKSFDSLITANASAKVCACQFLNLRSNISAIKKEAGESAVV